MTISSAKTKPFITIITLICTLPLISIGQARDQQIGLKITPSLSYRTLDGSNVDNGKAIVNSRNRNEAASLGYEIGLDYVHPITKEFSLRPGLNLSGQGYRYATESRINDYNALFYYTYLGIRLRGEYLFSSDDDRQFYLSGGISVNLLLDGRTNDEFYDLKPQPWKQNLAPESLHDRNHQAILGIGFRGALSEHLNFAFEPVFRHSINRIGTGSIKTYLWSLGAEMGVYYKF